MTEDEKRVIKNKIESELEHLEYQIEKLLEITKPIAPDCSLGRLTREEAITEQQVNVKILDESILKETRLHNALKRIDNDKFAICIECDEPIGLARILVRPESIRCVECASLL